MSNREEFEENLIRYRMDKIFKRYNITYDDLKIGNADGSPSEVLHCTKGDLDFIYRFNHPDKECFVTLHTKIGYLAFHFNDQGNFWFFANPRQFTRQNLVELDLSLIQETVDLIGGTIILAITENGDYFCFRVKAYEDEKGFELKNVYAALDYQNKIIRKTIKKKNALKKKDLKCLNLRSMIVDIEGLPRIDIEKLEDALKENDIEFDGDLDLDQGSLVKEILAPFLEAEGLSYIVAKGFDDEPFVDSSGTYLFIFPWFDSHGKNENSMIVSEQEIKKKIENGYKMYDLQQNRVDTIEDACIVCEDINIFTSHGNRKTDAFVVDTDSNNEEHWFDLNKYPNLSDYDLIFIDHVYQ